jgi:hypothetical protein
MDAVVDVECEFQVSDTFSQGFVVNHEVFIVQGDIVFVQGCLNSAKLLQFGLIVDGPSVDEDIFALFETEVCAALKVGFSSGNEGKV